MTKMLVTGAKGMVGSYVADIFSDHTLYMLDLPEFDITDPNKVNNMIAEARPDIVLHLAAETNVDKCETEREYARKVNVDGTRNVANACKENGSLLVHISTGYVFNGKGRYEHTEDDIPDPVNVYGKTKYQSELAVQNIVDNYYILRAEWMIGGGPSGDKKFVAKVIEKCLKGEDIAAVDDMYSTPTFARDFVNGIRYLIKNAPFGVYHLANKGICSRYELALEIVKDLGVKAQVMPVSSDKFPLPAPRAQSTGLRNYKLEKMGIDIMPRWQESLKEYIIKEWQIKK